MEMTGIVIEVVLLSILVPLVLYLVHKLRTRYIRSMVDFYLFQIFHKLTRMFLDMASINDIMPILIKEMEKDPEFKIFAHKFYGNLENILFVLNDTFCQHDVFRKEIEKKSLEDFVRYRDISERCLEEMDRLITMLIGLPRIQGELFNMRILVYGLRDMMEKAIQEVDKVGQDSSRTKFFYSYDVATQAILLTKIIGTIFNKRRKLIDSIMKHKEWFSKLRLLLSLPYLAVRTWVGRRVCQLRGKPYRKHEYGYRAPQTSMMGSIIAYLQHIKKERKR